MYLCAGCIRPWNGIGAFCKPSSLQCLVECLHLLFGVWDHLLATGKEAFVGQLRRYPLQHMGAERILMTSLKYESLGQLLLIIPPFFSFQRQMMGSCQVKRHLRAHSLSMWSHIAPFSCHRYMTPESLSENVAWDQLPGFSCASWKSPKEGTLEMRIRSIFYQRRLAW